MVKNKEEGSIDERGIKEQIKRLKEEEKRIRREKKTKSTDTETRRADISPDFSFSSEKDLGKIIKQLSSAEKKLLKKQIIAQRLIEYQKPIKTGKDEYYTPSDRDVREYKKILEELKLYQLKLMGHVISVPLKLDVMDRLKSFNKKEHAVVTIYNDNKTSDTGVIHCYDRTFSRNDMTYMVMGERGIYDPEFKMTHFYYYANQPCPILFQKGRLPENTYDSKLIDDTIQMKVIEALAAVDIEKFIKITLICSILTLCLCAVTVFILAKMSGIIKMG